MENFLLVGMAFAWGCTALALIYIRKLLKATAQRKVEVEEANRQLEQKINEHETAKKSLEESQKLLTDIATNMPGVIYKFMLCNDGSYRFPYMSDYAETVYGVPPQAIMENASLAFEKLLPEDLESVNQSILESAKNMTHWSHIFRLHTPSGKIKWFHGQSTPQATEDGVVWTGLFMDITLLKQAEEQLRKSQKLLKTAGRMAKVGGWEYVLKTQTLRWSEEVYRIHELDPDTPPDLEKAIEFYEPDAQPIVRYAVKQCLQGTPFDLELPLITAHGKHLWVRSLGRPEFEGETVVRLFGVFQDISEQKELETQLRQTQKMEAMGTLAGGIAHDFNNVLQGIMMSAETLHMSLPQESAAYREVSQLLSFTNRGAELVREILTFSRREEAVRQPLVLSSLVQETLKIIRSALPTTITIESNVQENHDAILGNSTQVRQVVLNLCSNAGYAMRESGGMLEIHLQKIDLVGQQATRLNLPSGDYLKLIIRDRGPGIPQDILQRIFDPFFTTKPVGEGSGMGLSVVHGIVKSHDGVIRVDSQLGRGTTFEVFFPIVESATEEIRPTSRSGHSGSARILLVDDEEELVRVEKKVLERRGYSVTAITSSTKALDLFRAQPDEFDIVLTDQTMPEMTGLRLSEELLKIRPDLPIILATGFSEAITPEALEEIGIRACIMKPFSANDAEQQIRSLIMTEASP